MIRRAFSDELSKIVNRPDIRPFFYPLCGDITLHGADEYGNVGLIDDATGGAMLFQGLKDGVYDCHVMFPKEVRGKAAIVTGKAMCEEMFARYGASAITGSTPRCNRAARVFGHRLGFRPTGRTSRNYGIVFMEYRLRRTQRG